ncbi:MAG: acyltransferase [Bacteroidota bacterium]
MYFKQIDSLRFFAVSLVLLAHWSYGLPYVERLRFSSIGVDLFFVISGFLISLQLYDFKNNIDKGQVTFSKTLKIFYVRRMLRIFPLYYFIIFVSALFNTGEIREALFWNIGYLSNFYFIKMQHWTSTFSHFWSLSVEEHFYLAWPFIVLLTSKKHLPYVFVCVSLLAVLFRYVSFSQNHNLFIVNIHTVSCLDLFMIGGALAYIYKYQHNLFMKIFSSVTYRYAILCCFIFLYYILVVRFDLVNFNWIFQRPLLGIVYASVIGFLVIGVTGNMGRLLENKYLIHLGKLSYGIYLVHNFIPGVLLPIKKIGLPFYIEFLVYFIVTYVISELLHRWIEKPVRNLNRHFKIDSGKFQKTI